MKARKLDLIVLAITLLIVTIAPIATAYAGTLTAKHHAYWQSGPYFGVRWKLPDNPLSLNLFVAQTATRGDEWCSIYTGAAYNLSVGDSW